MSADMKTRETPMGTFTLCKLPVATPFRCDRCKQNKTSKTVVQLLPADGSGEQILCNGCYGNLMSQA